MAMDACPLCTAALATEQEWCLQCGAAARTRLAATPRWRPPLVALALIAAIGAGVLTAALVKLVGPSSSSNAPAATRALAPAPGAAPAATTPGASSYPNAG